MVILLSHVTLLINLFHIHQLQKTHLTELQFFHASFE